VPSINSYVDFINLMEYDMHGSSWEPSKADHHAPLYKRAWDTDPTLSCNGSVSFWISQGASPSKLNMGIPLYGQSWTLTSSTVSPPAPANGAGIAGPYTAQSGYLGYNEICTNIKSDGWVKASDPQGLNGPYAYSLTSKQWVGFDDAAMVTTKTNYAQAKGLGGVMVWDISTDDFQNTCGGGKNPLIAAISAAASATGTTTAATTTTTPKATTTVATSTTTPKATTTVATTTTTPKATTTVAKTTSTTKASTTTTKMTTTPATTSTTTKATTSTTKATVTTTQSATTPTLSTTTKSSGIN
jgi:chitinase